MTLPDEARHSRLMQAAVLDWIVSQPCPIILTRRMRSYIIRPVLRHDQSGLEPDYYSLRDGVWAQLDAMKRRKRP